MAKPSKPSRGFMESHVAVRWKDSMVVLSDHNRRRVWLYNLWTEQWQKYSLQKGQYLPIEDGQCGVEIGSDIYMFRGFGQLWKLMRITDDLFAYDTIPTKDPTKTPSPREAYSAWQHGEKMWIFGGFGDPPVGYLHDYGDFIGAGSFTCNNQLLCYDPFSHMWTNIRCSGDTPSPRTYAAVAVTKDKSYLYGGHKSLQRLYDLYELSMRSFTWTQVKVSGPKPTYSLTTSLIPVTDNTLVLYCGNGHGKGCTKILDVKSHILKEHLETKIGHCFVNTGTTGLRGSAIILSGSIHSHQSYNPVLTVRIEPKSLQQLAMQMIYQKVDRTLWEMLPKTLRRKMMGTK